MNFTKYSNYLLLSLITLVSTIFFWLVFAFNLPSVLGFPHTSMETLFANYDGPNYLIISKCGYDKTCIGTHYSLPQPLEYYPAHLPGYPLMIRLLGTIMPSTWSMLLVTLLGSIFLTLVFYQFLCQFFKEKTAFWSTIILIFFPARFFILRQVGAPETWFLGLTLASILLFQKNKYFWAAVAAALAQAFKSPGIILFAAYGILFLKERNLKKYISFLLVPLTALAIFYFYQLQTGDFLAYFHSGDNFHLTLLPYSVFLSFKSWINSIWLEDIIYIFLFTFIGLYLLFQKHSIKIYTLFPLLFTAVTVLVAHRDISRYIAPVYPFLVLALTPYLKTKPLKIILLLLLPAIILYGINFVIGNTAPIADWTPYL